MSFLHARSLAARWWNVPLAVVTVGALVGCDAAGDQAPSSAHHHANDHQLAPSAVDKASHEDVKAAPKQDAIATVEWSADRLTFTPRTELASVTIRLHAPDGRSVDKTFSPGEQPFVDGALGDGVYTYEVIGAPIVTAEMRRAMRAIRAHEGDPEARAEIRAKHPLPTPTTRMSGTYRVENGQLVDPNVVEEVQ